jgi:hypothetical protein
MRAGAAPSHQTEMSVERGEGRPIAGKHALEVVGNGRQAEDAWSALSGGL